MWHGVVGVAKKLKYKLDVCFQVQYIMNTLGILYPQFWCSPTADEMFDKHLRTFMAAYGHGKILDDHDKKLLIHPLIDRHALIS